MDDSIRRAQEATALLVHMRMFCRAQEEKAAALAKTEVKDGISVTCPCGADVRNADEALQKMKRNMRAMRRGRL